MERAQVSAASSRQSTLLIRHGIHRCALRAAVATLLAINGLAQSPADPWLIQNTGETGTINAKTVRQDLVQHFGAANVVDKDIDIGEGETEPGTVVFPEDPKQRIDILWKNAAVKREPKSATIRGESSKWKAVHDISLGTCLKELERLNAKPFHMAGFAWDYSGTVTSWDGGLLEKDFEGKGRIFVRLDSSANAKVTEKEASEVMGDRDFSSHHPVMQKFDPCAYEIVWIFP